MTPRLPTLSPDAPRHVHMLIAIRQRYGWTQAELGQALDVTSRTIRQWEHQHTEPKSAWMAAFRELLAEASSRSAQ